MDESDLSELFDETRKQYIEKVEEGGASDKETINKLIYNFVRCNTMGIQALGLFADNEELSEISTQHLKYFLVPYYMAALFNRVQDMENPSNRIKHINQAIAQYRQYFENVKKYGLVDPKDEKEMEKLVGKEDEEGETQPQRKTPINPYTDRDEKMDRLRRKIQLEKKLKVLEERRKKEEEHELEREFNISLLHLCVLDSLEQVKLALQEIEMLQYALKQNLGNMLRQGGVNPHAQQRPQESQRTGPPNIVRITGSMETDLQAENVVQNLQSRGIGAQLVPRPQPQPTTDPVTDRVLRDLNERARIRDAVFTNPNPWTVSIEEFAEQEHRDMHDRAAKEKAAKEKEAKRDMESEEEIDAETYKKRSWDDYRDATPKGSGRLRDI